MEESRLADRMYRRTSDAPMSRRNGIDLLFIMQRHAVFAIDQDSADHISDIIFAQQTIDDMDTIKKYELLYDFHLGYDPSHRHQPRPAPRLRKAIEEARVKWSEILRDENLVDVRVVVFPSEERDFEHCNPPVDLAKHPFGNQLQRFQGLKTLLVEEGGAMPYRLKPRFGVSLNMEVDLIIAKGALERIATPEMQMILNFELQTITAPAARTVSEPLLPELLVRDGAYAQLSMENLARILRQRSSSIQKAVLGAPKKPWFFPYAAGSGRTSRQPQWADDEGPFSKDIFDIGSNSDWVLEDFAARKAQIDRWMAAKTARENALQTTVPDPDFVMLDGLAHCDTYAPDSDVARYAGKMIAGFMADYMTALEAEKLEAIRHQQALANLNRLKAQEFQRPDVVEYFRQVLATQSRILNRAKALRATISQGLPPPPPRRKMTIWRPPIKEAEEARQVEQPVPETPAVTDRGPAQAVAASGTPPAVFPFVLAEPGHTPIPEVRREMRGLGPTLRPSTRPTRDLLTRPIPTQIADRQTNQLKVPERRTNITEEGRAATASSRPGDPALTSGNIEPAMDGGEPEIAACHSNAVRKVRREVSFRLPKNRWPSPDEESPNLGGIGRRHSSSNKENETPSFKSSRLGSDTMKQQDSASLRGVPSVGQHIGMPCKSMPCSPNISPEVPKEFKVRGSRLRKNQNDAQQSLKLAADKDDTINRGSPQGVLPTLRRMVSGITGGLA